ncbi:MAG: thioester reductase domain-containing protein [Bacteroidetes bacterium]|nr:thioester reductase domain-containing protein [Bacteroidota bacterium]MDA1120448.1 thioester reductase domain-containing protein [Bacteroidota bacterium]
MPKLSERLDYWVGKSPDKLLFEFLDINGKSVEKYTFAEFDKAARIVATNLVENYNFKKDDRILITYPPGIEMIISFFACVKLGLIPVPTYPPSSSGFQSAYYKMEHIAKDCGASAVLTNGEYYWSLKLNMDRNNIVEETVLSKLPWINTSEFTHESGAKNYEQQSSVLFLQYTSGSTTDPKGVMVSHENIINNAENVLSEAPFGVSWLPQYHDMGLIGYHLFMIVMGGTTIGFSTLDFIRRPSLWLETISKYKANHSSAPNFAYDYVLQPGKISDETLASLDLSSLKILMTAAEPVRAATYNKFLEKFSAHGLKEGVYTAAYGLAENTLAVSQSGMKSLSVNTCALKNHELKLANGEGGDVTQIMSCGKPLKDQIIKIVDPNSSVELEDHKIGEVWLAGPSKGLGYWGKPKLSKEIFEAQITGENGSATHTFLRTGDLGFLHNEELYICGRAKDMIIIRGANYYPQDIEQIVEECSKKIRHGYVAAFANEENGEEKLVIVAGIKHKNKVPDHNKISDQIREKLSIIPSTITFTTTRSIPKTSSGKIMRQKAKQLWTNGELEVIESHMLVEESEGTPKIKSTNTPFDDIMKRYGFTGNETYSLVHVLDSLDLAVLIHDVKELLKKNGAAKLSSEIDARLLQEISVSEFFDLMQQFSTSSILAIKRLKNTILKLQKEHNAFEQKRMLQDTKLTFTPEAPNYDPEHLHSGKILLTGGTGFLGPFILKSLLEQTNETVYVLLRADNKEKGLARLKEGFDLSNIPESEYLSEFNKRVVPVCGDLSKPRLGLDAKSWNFLARNIHTIYNNGALVNYLFNYDKMRSTNVTGTNELIKLALDGNPKIFNHVSTTFIFGWAVKDTLFETDTCNSLDLLDFGYSQTKWVSEQIVLDAMKHGLKARIFRPALVTPSVYGGGNNFDISIRLIAFMINHGITVNSFNQVSFTPVDIVASNVVAISGLPDTIDKTFHVTRDEYARMLDITDIITRLTGREFKGFDLPKFVPQIVSKCRKEDLLFPLLDFLVRSVDNISSMEFKRYDNDSYSQSRTKSPNGIADPTLEDTVRGMLKFMINKEIVDVKLIESGVEVSR